MTEEELVRKYTKKVLILSRQYFLLGGDSDDLFQEGMIALVSAIRSYDPEGKAQFSTYAESCIRRRLIDTIKSKGYSAFTSMEDIIPEDTLPSAEDEIINREVYNDLLESIRNKLSAFEYSVLSLYLQGYTHSEIAIKLDKSVTSVYNAIQRSRNKLSAS